MKWVQKEYGSYDGSVRISQKIRQVIWKSPSMQYDGKIAYVENCQTYFHGTKQVKQGFDSVIFDMTVH